MTGTVVADPAAPATVQTTAAPAGPTHLPNTARLAGAPASEACDTATVAELPSTFPPVVTGNTRRGRLMAAIGV